MSSPASELKFPSRFIRAGAGAGKTTTLIRTFFDFVQQHRAAYGEFPRVIMTTFTRKATQEVKERLLLFAMEQNDPALFEFINKKSYVHISTIHGVLSLFLNQHHEVLGLPSDLRVVDAVLLRKKAFRELKNILKANPEYLELLEHYSFKDVLKHLDKLIELKREHPDLNFVSQKDLNLIFESKIQDALDALERVLAEPIPNTATWSDYFTYLQSFKSVLESKNIDTILQVYERKPKKPPFSKAKPPFDPGAHEALESLMGSKGFPFSTADSVVYWQEHEKINSLVLSLMQKLDEKLWQQKLKSGEISISDLELLSLQMIRQHPEAIQDFSFEYDYFMIDEYQDTSPLQVKILNALTHNRPHFIVGDPQQSIYLFRGARSEVFTSKEREADQRGYEKIILDRNYRTTARLMTFINHFFKEFSPAFSPMQTKNDDFKTHVPAEAYFIQSKSEIYAVLNQIQRLNAQGVQSSEICVLCRKNGTLMKLAQEAHKFGVAVQLQVAAGFDERREILDLVSFLRFLTNPHDSENLISLLRSPWFTSTDSEIVEQRQAGEFGLSYWSQLRTLKNDVYQKLQSFLNDYFQQGVMTALLNFIEHSGLLEHSHVIDSSGKREANIWKFVQNLQDQISQKSFLLNEYISAQFNQLQSDLGSSLSEGQPVISPDRVSLMTIHSSKGLEFNHVIVMGLSDNPQVTNVMPLSFDADAQKFSLAIFDSVEGKLQNSAWAVAVRESFNQRELDESERLLYVAMTRAKLSLTLVSEDRERIWETSWFKKMKWYTEGLHENPFFKVHSLYDNENPQILFSQHKERALVRPRLHYDGVVSESTSVTEMLDQKQAAEKNKIVAKSYIDNLHKAQKGTDLHRFFESLKYRGFDIEQDDHFQERTKAIHFLKNQSELPLEQILHQGHVEWGFGLRSSAGVIQGQIDAWGLLGDKCYILDYKTGSSQYLEKAYEQLRFYAACLHKMKLLTTQQIHLGVIYPLEEKVFQKQIQIKDLTDLL